MTYSTDPADNEWGLVDIQILHHLPPVLVFVSTFFLLVGTKLRTYGGRPMACLLLLTCFMLLGGSYTAVTQSGEIAFTSLNRALWSLTIIPAYVVGSVPTEHAVLARRFRIPMLLSPLVMFVLLVPWHAGYQVVSAPHIYHEEIIYAVAAMGALLARRWMDPTRRYVLLVACGLACVLTIKLTGFAFAILWMLLLAWQAGTGGRSAGSSSAANQRFLAVYVMIALILIAAVGYVVFKEILPSGSTNVRLVTYGIRLSEFTDSPIWGKLFVGSLGLELGWRTRVGSHSDLLDLLAFGGIIGFGLFLSGVLPALAHISRRLAEWVRVGAWLETYAALVVVCFLFEAAVNPVMGQSKLAIVFWTSLGLLLADRDKYGLLADKYRSSARHSRSLARPFDAGERFP